MAPCTRGSVRQGRPFRGQTVSEVGEPIANQPQEQNVDPPIEQPKPSMATLTMETLQTLIQTAVSNQMGQLNQDQRSMSVATRYLQEFKIYDPRSFDGLSTDPTFAVAWMSSMETIFRYMRCPEEHKVQCATFMLRDDALLWWEFTERTIDVSGGPVTWLQFKEAFFERYDLPITRKKEEFIQLKQGNQTVEEYEREFIKLSRFAPEHVDTEAKKIDRFIMGLKSELLGFVAALSPLNYARALQAATLLDNCPFRGSQLPSEPGSSSGQKRKFDETPSSSQQPQHTFGRSHHAQAQKRLAIQQEGTSNEKPVCSTCGRGHLGRCLAGTGVCFKCGQEGHMARSCRGKSIRGGGNQLSSSDLTSSSRQTHEEEEVFTNTGQEAEN